MYNLSDISRVVLYSAGVISLIFTFVYSSIYGTWLLLITSYVWGRFVGLIGNQIAQHRYFTHKSFETSYFGHKILLWFSILGGESSPIVWAIHHRHHHRYSDTELDVHSPHDSISLCVYKWQIKPTSWYLIEKKVRTMPRDLMRHTDVKFVDKHFYKIWILLVGISLAISWKFCIFFILAPVGYSMVNGSIGNFFGHWKIPGSYRNFDTGDKSYNNKWIMMYLGGEGLHNNHHHNMNNYNQKIKPDEIDIAAWIIKKFLIK